MAGQPQLKFLAIARMSDRQVLASECLQKGAEASFLAEAKTILGKLEEVYLNQDERQKIRSGNGAWFCTCDDRRIHYLVLADSGYPERHAYGLINDVRSELQGLNNYHTENNLAVQSFSRRSILPIVEKYNDLEKIDTIIATQGRMAQIKNVMSDTISKALENRETMDTLDKKSEELNRLAVGFYNSSNDLYNQARARKRRIIIYSVAAVVATAMIYFIVK